MQVIPKNSREELRIALDEFNGVDLVNMRVFFLADDGEMRPSRKGVALRVDQLPALIAALATEEQEAIRRGLLPDPDAPAEDAA